MMLFPLCINRFCNCHDDDDDDDDMPISFVKETGIPRGNHCPIRQVGLLLTKL